MPFLISSNHNHKEVVSESECLTISTRGFFLDFYIFFFVLYSTSAAPQIQLCRRIRTGIKPRAVATSALAVRRSNRSARSHPFDNTVLAYLESLVEVDRHLGGVAAEEDDHYGGEDPGHRCVAPASTDKTRLSSAAHSIVGIGKED
jgi:hypothetical protein